MGSATTVNVPLNFQLTPEDIVSHTKTAIEESKRALDVIGSLKPEECTIDTVVKAMAKQESAFREATAAIGFLQHASSDKSVRDASTEAEKLMDEYSIETGVREDLFQAAQALVANLGDGLNNLDGETKRYIEKLQLGFRLNGLELPAEKRKILKEKRKRLADLETSFGKNLADWDATLLFTAEELSGCPESFFETLQRKEVDGTELYVITTKYPDVFGVLKYSNNEETRRRVDVAFDSRAPQNEPLMEEAVKLRAECAVLLGFETHSDLILSERLAKNRKNVLEFEESLRSRLVPLALAEIEKLKQVKADELGLPVDQVTINSWDKAFYSRIILEREYRLEEEKVKEYFEVSHVTDEMLNIYETVLDLKFTRTYNLSVWHEEASAYEVKDAATNNVIGYFYLDLHPRDGKYTHAACFPLVPGYLKDEVTGERQIPVSAVLANFSRATATRPALLKHSEVVTLFHELGHAMHSMCAVVHYSRFHGTAVERDFVEAPSQMLENWCWDKATLKRLSKHHVTGESLPDDLVDSLIRTDKFQAGIFNLRQIFFGLFDMAIHSVSPGQSLPYDATSINDLYGRMWVDIALIPKAEGTVPPASFGHLMGGYDSAYYGYLWSKVFSSDMFASRFQAEGLDCTKTGMAYRHEILQPGGSREGTHSLKAFLGREPNQDAFLKSIGL